MSKRNWKPGDFVTVSDPTGQEFTGVIVGRSHDMFAEMLGIPGTSDLYTVGVQLPEKYATDVGITDQPTWDNTRVAYHPFAESELRPGKASPKLIEAVKKHNTALIERGFESRETEIESGIDPDFAGNPVA